MIRFPRPYFLLAAAAAVATIILYASFGQLKPLPLWNQLDIAGEASIAVMAATWFVMVLASRPPGRATTLLACGLGCLMLGALADCLDEFFLIAKGAHWNHLIESGSTLAGESEPTSVAPTASR